MATVSTQARMEKPKEKEEDEGPLASDCSSSSSSSPSHDFSFTISLPPSSSESSSRTAAVDLSPADDIFFHGHLLPLRLLSHPSTSPSASTTSLDSLPPRSLFPDEPKPAHTRSPSTGRPKPRYLSLFRLPKWRKPAEEEVENKKKGGFDVGRALRRYARGVTPVLFSRGEKETRERRRQQPPHSFSGNLNSTWTQWRGRKREFSAQASSRTSPANSGLLGAAGDSSMEELQTAIEAAIAHCKNSFASNEDNPCKY